MYKCERCGGTFDRFKVAGQCPLCGVWASVRCVCGYVGHANEFIRHGNVCPKCGSMVPMPGEGDLDTSSDDDFLDEDLEGDDDDAVTGCIGCAVMILLVAALIWFFGFRNKSEPAPKPAPPAATVTEPAPDTPPRKPADIKPAKGPAGETPGQPALNYEDVKISGVSADYLYVFGEKIPHFHVRARFEGAPGSALFFNKDSCVLIGADGKRREDYLFRVSRRSPGSKVLEQGGAQKEIIQVFDASKSGVDEWTITKIIKPGAGIECVFGKRGFFEIDLLWPVPDDFEHQEAILLNTFTISM